MAAAGQSGKDVVSEIDETLGRMLDAVAEWQEDVDNFVATGSDDDPVIVTHDSRGRLIEMWVDPGLQQKLSLAELEDAMNAALAGNVERARKGYDEMTDKFLHQFTKAPYTKMPAHPVGNQLAETFARVTGRSR